jgi:hypothetical protein
MSTATIAVPPSKLQVARKRQGAIEPTPHDLLLAGAGQVLLELVTKT